jgi:hypothetical protein
MGYLGLTNDILLSQHNEVLALDINSEKNLYLIVSNNLLKIILPSI